MNDKALAMLLDGGAILVHPFVIGELALGRLRQRELSDLPHASVATDEEVLHFIERHTLFGRGIGYVGAHLLAAVQLTAGAALWTKDERLHGVAIALGMAVPPARGRAS